MAVRYNINIKYNFIANQRFRNHRQQADVVTVYVLYCI
jgi:hypothetical protein